MSSDTRQRGEGKIGCVLTLLVLAVVVGGLFKVVPVLWSNNELQDRALDLAARSSTTPIPALEEQLRVKAKELEIPEALVAGAMQLRKTGDGITGTCSVTLRYSRKIDFYGIWSVDIPTDYTKSVPYMNAN